MPFVFVRVCSRQGAGRISNPFIYEIKGGGRVRVMHVLGHWLGK